MNKYSIGVDFGTESGRVVIIDVRSGDIVGSHITEYSHGVITKKLPGSGTELKRETALQHPGDYLQVLETSIPEALNQAGVSADKVVGVGVDFTASTILPVKEDFEPLCFDEKWSGDPHAWVKLWKHHGAQEQADRINQLAKDKGAEWLKRYGGIISSEWMVPKVLETLEESPQVYKETDYFIEACDWVTSQMTGVLSRNSCAAGYKGMWSKREGYIDREFLKELNPNLADLYDTKLSREVVSLGNRAGLLSEHFAKRVGLKLGTPVAIGLIDAHAGVPGSNITAPESMVMVMGTSTCHMLLSDKEVFVEGISGVVEDGIIPGFYGYEAGQAAVGDIFSWFVKENVPKYVHEKAEENQQNIHGYLEGLASNLPPGANGLLALDWHNGCRTPLVDANLSGCFVGQTLTTKPEEMYRALLEATAYGTRMIIEQFSKENVEINELVACGGMPKKNRLLMQIYADVTGRPIKIVDSEITPAIGSAIYGAVAAGSDKGGYDSVQEAANHMASSLAYEVEPNKDHKRLYDTLYEEYVKLSEYFGRGMNNVMKVLKNL